LAEFREVFLGIFHLFLASGKKRKKTENNGKKIAAGNFSAGTFSADNTILYNVTRIQTFL
jgi:hypothetical protein